LAQIAKLFRQHPGVTDALWVVAMTIPAIAPFLSRLPRGYDTALHILRIVLLDHMLAEGQIWPRWAADLFFGFGYPLFNFYAPAVYYLGVVFHRLGADGAVAFQLVTSSLLLVAALGAWQLCTELLPSAGASPDVDLQGQAGHRLAAIVGAVAYVYAPYVLVNIYVRGAIAELAAQALLPWALLFVRRSLLSPDPIRHAPAAALVLAAIVLSHTISLLLIPPFIFCLTLAQMREQTSRWRWPLAIGLGAVALSAIFWLPLVVERSAVGSVAYQAALPTGVEAFLRPDELVWTGVPFDYARITSGLRFGLSPIHLLLGLGGLVLLRRRRTAEWVVYGLTLVAVAGLQLDFTKALWDLGGLIEIVQAPSRLQTLLYLSVAVLGAAAITRLPAHVERLPAGLAMIAVFMAVGAPWAIRMPPWLASVNEAGLAEISGAEAIGSNFGLSAYPEFLPRWVNLAGELANPASVETSPAVVSLTARGPVDYRLRVQAASAWTLQTADFYFPGWSAWIDDVPVAVSANGPLGLVSIAVPEGDHRVRIAFAGSWAQQLGLLISTLSALTAAILLIGRRRWATATGLALAALAGVWLSSGWQPELRPVAWTPSTIDGAPFTLLDFQAIPVGSDRLSLQAAWFVRQTAPDDLTYRWALRTSDGVIAAETRARPWFDHGHTRAWPSGAIVDDRAELVLPPELPPGQYRLTVCAQPAAQRLEPCDPQTIVATNIVLARAAQGRAPAASRFTLEGGLELVDAQLETTAGALPLGGDAPIVARHDDLIVRLIWRTTAWLLPERLESSPALENQQGARLSYSTFSLGGLLKWPRALAPGSLVIDRQPVFIDPHAQSGRYPLTVRVFDLGAGRLLQRLDEAGRSIGDVISVGDVKVVAPATLTVRTRRAATIGDLARFAGYELDPGTGLTRPGATLTLTVVYQALHTADRDLTQFVHVYNPALGLIGQADSPPLAGNNPTDHWVAGEIIRDTLTLTIAPDAAPGTYTVLWGLYDPATGERLPVALPDGTQPEDRALPLAVITIAGS